MTIHPQFEEESFTHYDFYDDIPPLPEGYDPLDNERRNSIHMMNDVVFHSIFARGTPETNRALMDMLNVLLETGEDPIVGVTIKNPVMNRRRKRDKGPILDIRAETDKGQQLDIEVQRTKFGFFINRTIHYGGKLMAGALQNGEDYDKMRQSIVIGAVSLSGAGKDPEEADAGGSERYREAGSIFQVCDQPEVQGRCEEAHKGGFFRDVREFIERTHRR